jgi:hypothetical protein
MSIDINDINSFCMNSIEYVGFIKYQAADADKELPPRSVSSTPLIRLFGLSNKTNYEIFGQVRFPEPWRHSEISRLWES